MKSKSNADRLDRLFGRYKNNLPLFAREVCQADVDSNPNQRVFMKAIQQHRFVAVRSGHKIAKTCTLAICVLYCLCFLPGVKVIALSGGHYAGMDSTLFPEIKKWYAKMPVLFKNMIDIKTLRQTFDVGFCVAKSPRPNDREALQGLHAHDAYLIFLVDEASGLADEHFDSIQGSLQGENVKCILAGNPLSNTGFFHDAFTTDQRFTRLHFSSLDSPLVSKEWADEILRRYGPDSIEYRVKVLGLFPLQEPGCLISYELSVAAMETPMPTALEGDHVWAVDPARFGGDDVAMAKRQGNCVYDVQTLKGRVKATQILGWVIGELRTTPLSRRPSRVVIDTAGLGGPIMDFMEAAGQSCSDIDVTFCDMNPGQTEGVRPEYNRMKDQLYCSLRDFVRDEKPVIINNTELLAQMAEIKYDFTTTGKITVLKDKMKKSPNELDAVAYTFFGQGYEDVGLTWI